MWWGRVLVEYGVGCHDEIGGGGRWGVREKFGFCLDRYELEGRKVFLVFCRRWETGFCASMLLTLVDLCCKVGSGLVMVFLFFV